MTQPPCGDGASLLSSLRDRLETVSARSVDLAFSTAAVLEGGVGAALLPAGPATQRNVEGVAVASAIAVESEGAGRPLVEPSSTSRRRSRAAMGGGRRDRSIFGAPAMKAGRGRSIGEESEAVISACTVRAWSV